MNEGFIEMSASKKIVKFAISAIILIHVRKALKEWRKK